MKQCRINRKAFHGGGNRRHNSGFTLLETLAALAIVGGVMAIAFAAAPEVAQQSENRRLAARIERELRLTRTEAIRSGGRTMFSIDISDRSFRGVAGSAGGKLPAGFALDILSAAEAQVGSMSGVLFMPDGTSSGGVMTLSRGGWRKQWTINWLTGDVRS